MLDNETTKTMRYEGYWPQFRACGPSKVYKVFDKLLRENDKPSPQVRVKDIYTGGIMFECQDPAIWQVLRQKITRPMNVGGFV